MNVAASRERKLPAKLSASVVTSFLGKSGSIKSDEDLRRLWNKVLDQQIRKLNSHFHDVTYGFMSAAVLCLPRSNTFRDRDSLTVACKHFNMDISDAELTMFMQQLKHKADAGQDLPLLMEVLDNSPEDIFPNIIKMI